MARTGERMPCDYGVPTETGHRELAPLDRLRPRTDPNESTASYRLHVPVTRRPFGDRA
jgi:hypothetical protein